MEEEIRITLRLPRSLRDRVKKNGKAAGRSLNGEIVFALETAYPDEKEHLRRALNVISREVEREGIDPERRDRLLAARDQLLLDVFYEPMDVVDDEGDDE